MTETETSQTINSIFLTNGKEKKHLQPSTKYPMRLCKACNIHIAENYLSNHKRTNKHLINQQIREEKEKKTNIHYVNDKLIQEIKELEYKLKSFEDGKKAINNTLVTLDNEYDIIQNQYDKYNDMLSIKKYEINQMKIEHNNFNDVIKKVTEELNTKKQILEYTTNI